MATVADAFPSPQPCRYRTSTTRHSWHFDAKTSTKPPIFSLGLCRYQNHDNCRNVSSVLLSIWHGRPTAGIALHDRCRYLTQDGNPPINMSSITVLIGLASMLRGSSSASKGNAVARTSAWSLYNTLQTHFGVDPRLWRQTLTLLWSRASAARRLSLVLVSPLHVLAKDSEGSDSSRPHTGGPPAATDPKPHA